jgi:hypothetical protein
MKCTAGTAIPTMSPAERCTPEMVRAATSFLSTIGKGVHPEALGDDGRQIGQFCTSLGTVSGPAWFRLLWLASRALGRR